MFVCIYIYILIRCFIVQLIFPNRVESRDFVPVLARNRSNWLTSSAAASILYCSSGPLAIADDILKLCAVKAAIAIMNDVLKCDPLAATDFILP